MHTVLFGGAFDPPHLGHITVVKNFIELGVADQLVFLPVHTHAFEKSMIESNHRLEMLEEVKRNHFRDLPVYISDYELTKPGMSITFDTLSELSKQNPHHQYSFLIGSDNLADFDKWHHFEEMLEKYKFFVYPRAGFSFDNLREGMIVLKDMPEMKVSSSVIKEKLENNDSVEDLLSTEIINYIEKNNLY